MERDGSFNEDRYRALTDERFHALEAASIEASNAGLKALLLLNGGAAVALLAFLANTFSADMDTDRARFFQAAVSSLVFFASGAGLSVLVSVFAYLTNQSYAGALFLKGEEHDRAWRRATVLNNTGLALALCSLAAFFGGVFKMWNAI